MKLLFCIALREYLATVKTKTFLVGLILTPVLMCGSIIGMALMQNQVDLRDRHVAVIDPDKRILPGLVEAAQKRRQETAVNAEGEKVLPFYDFELDETLDGESIDQQKLRLSRWVREGKLHGFIEVGARLFETKDPREPEEMVSFYAKNPALDDLRQWLIAPVNEAVRAHHLSAMGITREAATPLFLWHQVEGMELIEAGKGDLPSKARKVDYLKAVGVPVFAMLLLLILVLMGSMPLMTSVLEEKNQHIAETLLSSVTPMLLMGGKLIGGVAISLTASAVYIGTTLGTLGVMGLSGYVPLALIPLFLVYLILATLMNGSCFAAIGAVCNDLKETQNLTLPVMLPMMVPTFILLPILKEPASQLATTLSLIPPLTPMLLMLRQSLPGGVPLWQSLAGLAGLMLYSLFCIWAASRVFRLGILMKGKTPGFATLLRWVFRA
jgi:ABC-2 type transport system permease protein